MTALCGGGTSGPKLGAAAVVDYSSGLIAEALAALETGWLIPVIPLLVIPPLVLVSFCSSDPPPVPVFTQAEVNALLQLTLGPDFDSGLSKAKDWVLNTIWNDACQCTSGSYTPPTPPAQPSGSITVVQPSGQSSVAWCGDAGSINTTNPIVQTASNTGSIGSTLAAQMSYFRVHVTRNSVGTGPHENSTVAVLWFDGTNSFNQTIATVPPDGIERTYDLQLLQPYTTVSQIGFYSPHTSTDTKSCWTEVFCPVSGQSAQPCCPPDTATQQYLDNIMRLLVAMQRNYMPFAYVRGATHSGLSGSGSFAISRLIGVQVTITTIPPASTSMPGNPPYVRDLGWMSASEVDGMIEERRVSQQQFTWFPRLMPVADHVNYAFTPGTVANITELEAEV